MPATAAQAAFVILAALMEQENPSELKPAILFALLYARVLLAVATVKQFFGKGGLCETRTTRHRLGAHHACVKVMLVKSAD